MKTDTNKKTTNRIKVALAGQPNCGKSTIFNLISGIHQHIANYPGVTVDKKVGHFNFQNNRIEVVDLPGTYSFSSYSLEEKVAKEFIINENPDIILNIIDASNLKRNLYLTFQLLEIGKPVIVVLNMCDVAERRGIIIDTDKISKMLNCPVIKASGSKGIGGDKILDAIVNKTKENREFKIDYGELESYIKTIEKQLDFESPSVNKRWVSIKALDGDKYILDVLKEKNPDIQTQTKSIRDEFNNKFNKDIESFLAHTRYENADIIFHQCAVETKKGQTTITDIIDKVVLNRWLSFPILLGVIFLIYQFSIVYGYKLTDYTWPLLAALKNFIVDISPDGDIIHTSLISDLALWLINSANALLNYIPIFLILFALIAILEDIGYMPRMAFILDKIFKKYGLHGQSTLPLVLGGAFVGGCAVPGLMATKGIADDRARMATIMSVPLMNCLAKVPFYTLLVGAFFPNDMGLMLFYISTITIFGALIIAKILTSTVLKNRETAPFVMELPPYHLPTVKGVIIKALQRVWLYIKKVVTIVMAVAVILFAMIQLPGLSDERLAIYDKKEQKILQNFDKKVNKTKYYEDINSREEISELLNLYDSYKSKKLARSKSVDADFAKAFPSGYRFLKVKKGDKDARVVNVALRKLANERNKIFREQKAEKIKNSILGSIGRGLEPISQYAGFDWKINVAFLSSFAARESAVATLGSIYEQGMVHPTSEKELRPEETMAINSGYTPLMAASIIIFMLLTPPCIATMIVLKLQTNSWLWMSFALVFPFSLALFVSSVFFTVSKAFDLEGLDAMTIYYISLAVLTILLGLIKEKRKNWTSTISTNIRSTQ